MLQEKNVVEEEEAAAAVDVVVVVEEEEVVVALVAAEEEVEVEVDLWGLHQVNLYFIQSIKCAFPIKTNFIVVCEIF